MSTELNEKAAKLSGWTEITRIHQAGSVFNPTGWLWGTPPGADEACWVPNYCYDFESFKHDVLSRLTFEQFDYYMTIAVANSHTDMSVIPDVLERKVVRNVLLADTKAHVKAYVTAMENLPHEFRNAASKT